MDEGTFDQLILYHIDSLYGFAKVLIGTGDGAEDLVHETYLKATQNRCQYKHDTNCKAWLFTVMKNLFLNNIRRHRREVLFGSFTLEDGEEDPVFMTVSIHPTPELRMDLEKAFAALPENLRLVVMLRDQEGLEYQEIAEIFCCPVGTVMSRLARGRASIKKFILEQ